MCLIQTVWWKTHCISIQEAKGHCIPVSHIVWIGADLQSKESHCQTRPKILWPILSPFMLLDEFHWINEVKTRATNDNKKTMFLLSVKLPQCKADVSKRFITLAWVKEVASSSKPSVTWAKLVSHCVLAPSLVLPWMPYQRSVWCWEASVWLMDKLQTKSSLN